MTGCDEAFDTELDGGDSDAANDCDLDCVESYVADWVGDGIREAFVDGGDCDVSVDGDDTGDAGADADTATGADTGADADTGGPAVDDDTDSADWSLSDGGASETSDSGAS